MVLGLYKTWLYAVEDSEMGVHVPNIIDHNESQTVDCEVAIDCSSNESEDETLLSDNLEVIALQKKREISEKLIEYKELYKGMTFKDIPEARKVINLYCLANCYGLKQLKSDSIRLRYMCEVGCPFVCLISEDKNGGRVKIKTLKSKHKCNPAYDNPKIDKNTIAEYFKNKLQENPMIKVKEMKMTLKNTFNINVSHAKCKRAKRMILESLAGSFTDEYNKIEAYANELRLSNPESDAKGQLLVDVALDSMNHFYPIAWAVVDKETKVTWTWFLTLLNNSLDLKLGEGYTFMPDMQKGLIEAVQAIVPDAHHRYCVRHIEANWCRRWGAGDFKKKYLWWCA
uniref:MULE transposase domain-containing protein n=1 Tax=Nicotiana tabacum TaxID=4097 RepID=A0A1S4A8Q8_TOBAC|nr:PREDICTED: uncharacterized protein LOC107794983 [Nicotiana tabacum]